MFGVSLSIAFVVTHASDSFAPPRFLTAAGVTDSIGPSAEFAGLMGTPAIPKP
jgi:hypothetical protein